MVKQPIHQDLTMWNIYVPNTGASKYTQQILTFEGWNKNTIRVKHFNFFENLKTELPHHPAILLSYTTHKINSTTELPGKPQIKNLHVRPDTIKFLEK